MPRTRDRAVLVWILSFASFAVILVVLGGFVRLTRAGLSIVEWNPVYGAVPPLTQAAWQSEFSKYQLSPEYQQINKGMTLAAYQEIFLIEWVHRLLARTAGLVFAVPFFVLLWKRRIPLQEAPVYVLMGILFLAQALMGWIMVASGLVDRPAVSHYLLASHLFLALSLIGLAV
ncbi:MAG TPA: COX15/CtaA family protein, partial [Anaerolineales bacterium]|nr:COX15/CtaA family protein [Anaerolineales bacterium]